MVLPVNAPQIAHSIIKHKGGPAKTNRYRVVLPTMFIGGDAITMDVLCRSVTIPSRQITTTERRTGMKEYQMPTGYVNDDITMIFTETMDQSVTKYFEGWMNRIVDPDTHALAFKKDIERDLIIMPTNEDGIPTRIYKVMNAFPKGKPAVTYSDSSQNTIAEVSVSWVYDDFEVFENPALDIVQDATNIIKSDSFTLPTNILGSTTRGLGGF